jgi:hypothetical protein
MRNVLNAEVINGKGMGTAHGARCMGMGFEGCGRRYIDRGMWNAEGEKIRR